VLVLFFARGLVGHPYSGPMKILGWNCRGICNASTIRSLKALIRGHNCQVIFLSETKASESQMRKVVELIGFSDHVCVGVRGIAGDVCMLWSNVVKVEVLEFNALTIVMKVNDCFCSWALIGFYGPTY
jgi:exonuclease III